jgi:WXG100 family type VII secretion target
MAGGSGYSVRIDALEEVANEMQRYQTKIQQTLDRLEREARTTLDEEHWKDSAKDSYVTAKANWDRAADSMRTKLHASFTALIDIVQDYSEAEVRAVKSMDHTGLV